MCCFKARFAVLKLNFYNIRNWRYFFNFCDFILHPLLPNHRNSKIRKSPRSRGHNYIFYHTSRPTSSKTVFKHVCFIHLVGVLSCFIPCVCYFPYFNILAFMCFNVFSVFMSSAYIIRATDMHSIKKQLTYLSVVYVLSWHTEHTVQSSNMHYTSSRQISWQSV